MEGRSWPEVVEREKGRVAAYESTERK